MTASISLGQQIEELRALDAEISRDLRRWSKSVGASERQAEYRLERLRAAIETLKGLRGTLREGGR